MEPDNSPMIRVWDGEVGQRWVTEQARYERMHAPFGSTLLAAAQLRPGMRVLDAGCGMGDRTIDAATTVGPHGKVVGVDVASPMLQVAQHRAIELGLDNARFIRADVQTTEDLGFEEFDLALSQFGVMFFADPDAAFANLCTALHPGGRLVFTCWQDLTHQQHLMVPLTAALEHVPTPEFTADSWSYSAFSLADPTRTQALLAKAGFTDVEIQPTVAPMYQGADLSDTLRFLRQSELGDAVFGDAGPAATAQGWEAVGTALAPYVREDGVFLDGAAWLVTATRT